MRIRTQLAAAFLALAVVPLAGIVLYSYWTSRQAVARALEAEAGAMAEQLAERLSAIRGDLRDRLGVLGELRFDAVTQVALDPEATPPPGWLEQVARVMGDSGALVESLEVLPVPRPPRAAATGSQPSPPHPPTPPPPLHPSPAPHPPSPAPHLHGVAPDTDERNGPVLVIDLPELLELGRDEAMSAAHQALIEAQTELSRSSAPTADFPPGEALGQLAGELGLRIAADALRIAGETTRRVAEESVRREELSQRIRSVVELRHQGGHPTARPVAPPLLVEVRSSAGQATALRAAVSRELLLRRVLAATPSGEEDFSFAIDDEGELHLIGAEAAERLGDLPRQAAARAAETGQMAGVVGDWVVATTRDPETGIAFGVARPLREPLRALRRTAARNFGWGLALVGLALLGILPLTTHLTSDLARVTAGAERIASGDLGTRVEVRSSNEIGRLAATFNRMAEDLAGHQERRLEQRLLEVELARRAQELEEARQLQLSLLPRSVPQLSGLEIAVVMRTATEVGGDYYDFQTAEDGSLVVAIGDATGHGAQAGTMVTVIKGLFSAWQGGRDLGGFLTLASTALRRMDLGRMLMAFALLRIEGDRVTVASAGMPPVLLWRRRNRQVEEVDLPGLPLGSLGSLYPQQQLEGLERGDVILLMSDGLAELQDPEGEVFGYARVAEALATLAELTPEEILAGLMARAEQWAAERPAEDDLTFVVVRCGGDGA
jgi:serine phosphatase RsbU (regulator of sigma subunit)